MIVALYVNVVLCSVVAVSFLLSKKFINAEFNKLEGRSDNKFDRVVALFSAVVLSFLITFVSTRYISILLKYLCSDIDIVCMYQAKLATVFSVFLILGYTISAPSHPNMRFINILDEEACVINRKFFRMMVISFTLTSIMSLFNGFSAKIQLVVGYLFSVLAVIYYFLEMMGSADLMHKIFCTKKLYSFSSKLITFINEKITFLCLIGMLIIVFINHSRYDAIFFDNLENIYYFLLATFVLQVFISRIISKFVNKLNFITDGKHSNSSTSQRRKNRIWICDVAVVVFYVSIICIVLKKVGVSLPKQMFHDKVMTIGGIIFITTVIYKGFNEFADAMLENAETNDLDYKTKLQTFFPPLSAVFYIILFATSTLLILANLEINIAPILATFTVFSAAVGLAAKDIIQSFLYGIVFLIEKNLYVGACVKIDELDGIIEKLSTRMLYLRCDDGSVHLIPYNMINTVTDYSKNCVYYYDELLIDTGADLDKISHILVKVVEDVRNDGNYCNKILDGVEIYGLKPFDTIGVKICWRIKTSPNAIGKVLKYEIYRRLYLEFQKQGIHIPIASLAVNTIS